MWLRWGFRFLDDAGGDRGWRRGLAGGLLMKLLRGGGTLYVCLRGWWVFWMRCGR